MFYVPTRSLSWDYSVCTSKNVYYASFRWIPLLVPFLVKKNIIYNIINKGAPSNSCLSRSAEIHSELVKLARSYSSFDYGGQRDNILWLSGLSDVSSPGFHSNHLCNHLHYIDWEWGTVVCLLVRREKLECCYYKTKVDAFWEGRNHRLLLRSFLGKRKKVHLKGIIIDIHKDACQRIFTEPL